MKGLWNLFISIVFVVIISGCSNNEDKIELLFISDIPNSMTERIESIVMDAVTIKEEDFEVSIHPITYERLIVEIASHNGDILFLDEELMSAAYDPDGLYPLGHILDDKLISLIPDDYKAIDAETGKNHVYALPLDNDSTFLQHLGVKLENPLVAIIPVYTENQAFSFELLQYIIENN